MSCARLVAALLALAASSLAAGINSDSAITAGEGQRVSKTKVRYSRLEQDIDRYLVEETFLYGLTHKISIISSLGYLWNSPGPSGLSDLAVRGRFKLYGKDGKRKTFIISGIAGVEVPIGEQPIGSPDGGLRGGLVGTWEENLWRIDADAIFTWRPNAGDVVRGDVALVYSFHENKNVLWQAVLELNYRRVGNADVLFLAPGMVYEIRGWKIEGSTQIAVATDSNRPTEKFALVLAVTRVF